jgi:uncharacterized metal-binding protein YceD (DUF177 family)
MHPLRQYEIAFVGLKHGVTDFNYHIDDRFFELFAGSLVEQADINVILKFDKHTSFFNLHFELEGKIHLPCDRCGSELDYPVENEYSIVVKFDEHHEDEQDDSLADVVYIGRHETHFSVAQLIYEFVNLSIPINHVTCDNLTGKKPCNQNVLNELNNLAVKHHLPANPRWNDLTKIKFN